MLKALLKLFSNRLLSRGIEAVSEPDPDSIRMYEPSPPAVNQTKTLFISAGHSDAQPGAVGFGFTEAMIVTEFRDLVANKLRDRGIVFDKDGRAGENLPLNHAIAAAKQHDVAVEWHCNAFTSPSATGVETLCNDPGNAVSINLCTVTASVLGIANRGSKPQASGQHSRLGFVETGGGIIHELFFITNQNDLKSYLEHKHLLADRVAEVLAVHVCD